LDTTLQRGKQAADGIAAGAGVLAVGAATTPAVVALAPTPTGVAVIEGTGMAVVGAASGVARANR